jgi:hypothetical protein
MAITIVEQPVTSHLPAYNKILFKVISDEVLQSGFKYAIRIRNEKTATIIATSYYYPYYDPSQPIEIDVSHFIQNDFNYYKGLLTNPSSPINQSGWMRSDSLITAFKIEFFEYWDNDADGVLEIVTSSQVDSDVYFALPISYNNYERYFYDTSTLIGNAITLHKPLTSYYSINLSKNAYYNFAFLDNVPLMPTATSNILDIVSLDVKSYDSSNNLLLTTNYPNTSIPTNIYEQISYFHLDASGLPANTKYVRLSLHYLVNGVTNVSHDNFVLINLIECERNKSKTLLYLNKYGAYDTYTFPLNNFTTKELNKQTYKRFYTDYGYTNEDGIYRFRNTNPVYYSRLKTMMILQTNWLSDRESECLEELFSSSSVYLLDNENNPLSVTFERNGIEQPVKLIPVNIKDTNYEVRYERAHKNFQYTCNIEFAELESRQTT